MPEISLNEYFSKLNGLLSANAVDEVFLHCRHILQYFPKNVTAYRFLGRALVMNGRWEEGREALRRVLSVVPDDYVAHLYLSESNERVGRSDEAIWHLERAFEQRPNDKDIIDALRNLYSQHRNVHNLKIQLTSAAVARQYVRSGAYTQAVDTLRSALSRMNERLDLKLLLAQILWEHGEQEESAELALEVLGVLPDCLEANKIMAQLWLGVNRPSDAQRYVNHLEAVDPYLAVEVAQGYPPDDDAFRLDELDYVSTSQSEIASGKLDWLQEISSLPTPAAESEPEAAGVGDEWSDWASAMLNGKAPPEPKVEAAERAAEDDFGPTSSRFAAMAENEMVNSSASESGFTDFFGKPEEADAEELSAMFAPRPAVDRDDPMAWLHEAGVEIVQSEEEEPSFEDLFAADQDGAPALMDEDPMAWLRDSTGAPAANDEFAAPAASTSYGNNAVDTADDDDPFAWMLNDAGVALDDVLPDSNEQNGEALDWLQDERILAEAGELEQLTASDSASAWDSMAGMGDDDLPEESPADQPPDMAGVPGPRRGLTAMLQEANLDWVTRKEDEVASDSEMDEWLTQFGGQPEKPVTDSPDWLSQLDQPQTGEASNGSTDSAFTGGDETPAWGSADDDEPQANDGVDWMRDLTIQPEAADDEFASMSGESGADDEEPAEGEMPDWLSELEPDDEADESESEAAPADLNWLADATSADVAGTDDEVQAAEIPDWMSELAPEQSDELETAEPALEPPSASDFPWMNEEAEPVEAGETAVQASETMPDWLAELAPETETSESEVQAALSPEMGAADDMSWLNEESLTGAEAEADAEAVAGEMPDWLSELAPETETAPSVTPELEQPSIGDFPWMGDETPEAESAAIDAVDGDFPWMNEVVAETVISDEPEAEAVSETIAEDAAEDAPVSTPDWLAELEPDGAQDAAEADAEAEAGVLPEWLSELEPVAEAGETEPQMEAEAVSTDDDSWLNEEPAVAESIPEWLSELEPSQQETVAETPAAADDDLAWLDEVPESEPVAADAPVAESVASETGEPDWLTESEPATVAESAYDEEEDLVAEMSSNFDDSETFDEDEPEYGFLEEDDILEPSPAQNAPDWLNAMVPGLDVDYAAEDELFDDDFEEDLDESQREYAWLTDMVDEEMAATERPVFAFSRPPTWFGASGAARDDGGMDDELPDWPSDDADADVPEWLR